MTDWKKKFMTNPNRRRMAYSKKTGKWLTEEETDTLLKMLEENKKKITEILAKEPDAQEKIPDSKE